MNGFSQRVQRSEWVHWKRRVLAAGLLGLCLTFPIAASPITIQNEWTSFLEGGKAEWTTTSPPPITLRIKEEMVEALASASPTSTLFVQYLEWRRDLDPARFDHWHPEMGPVLQTLATTPATTPNVNPEAQ